MQDPDETVPLITSQYAPFANEVVKVALQAESSLLIATKPAEPVVTVINGEKVISLT